MLTIGEFSKICEVSTKTLRYYDEINLIKPNVINPESGYRYYAIEQLEIMLLINHLKQYSFSLEEIREIMHANDETLYFRLHKKKKEIEKQVQVYTNTLEQIQLDITNLKQGTSILSYLNNIDIQLVDIPTMYLLTMRKMVPQAELEGQYAVCFHSLERRIMQDNLTMIDPPMVLFHSDEFDPFGIDIEFAIPIQEYVTGSRDFHPGLCLKTVLYGPYTNLPSVYTKQCVWAQQNGYENNGPLYEVYRTDPSTIAHEDDLITEVYYPIKKKTTYKKG